MKHLIVILSIILLIGCSATSPTPKPTPFKITDQKVKVQGCEDLKKRVKEWNEKNPNKEPKKADC